MTVTLTDVTEQVCCPPSSTAKTHWGWILRNKEGRTCDLDLSNGVTEHEIQWHEELDEESAARWQVDYTGRLPGEVGSALFLLEQPLIPV